MNSVVIGGGMVRPGLARANRVARCGRRHPVRCAPMSASQVTRFAPSPTGSVHLGNARTALFNMLEARATGGRFVLRIEDTDAARSDERLLGSLLEDLAWLGLAWDEGPDVGGAHGPYRQSERTQAHATAVARLTERGAAYPCFCSAEELDLTRRAQLASGRPPRYSGKCASLSAADVEARIAAGARPLLRFRVPRGRAIEFDDAIHGRQRFSSDDIGDFVIRRADGSVPFMLGNAVDDSAMGITLVLRGDDHLANTPRQLLLLEALDLRVPAYGHLPLVLSPGGAPLSKREGAASLADLRGVGYLPVALCNYLVRLGHGVDDAGCLDAAGLVRVFDLRRTSRSAAHFDPVQLRHWQREAVMHTSPAELEAWLGERLAPIAASQRAAFVAAVRGNVLFPDDVLPLVTVVAADTIALSEEARSGIRLAGAGFYARALEAWRACGPDYRSWTRQLGELTQTRGASLYRPLRAALTGETHGPELAPLVALMGTERVERRLDAARAAAE
jgi:glutamyl-tRNA synthetase